MRLLEELKRRNVFRVGAGYVLLGWLVIQVTDTVSPALGLPDWTLSMVTFLGIIGFPFALFFAWAYELTPDGIVRESKVDRTESVRDATGRKLDIALIVLLVAAIAFIAWDRIPDSPEQQQTARNEPAARQSGIPGAPDISAIAVLPLINMSAVADNAYFAGGVHEEILTNLSRIDGLRVVSRTTALRYLNSELSLRDIGEELDVRYIVEGSVRRIDDHVRITVQLIDADEDVHLWARNYDRELVDVFATQSEVARQIADALHLEIQPETVGTLKEMPTHSVMAYDLYLKARSMDRSEPLSEEMLQSMRQLVEAAVSEDPDFVEAWAWLNEVLDEMARTIIQAGWFGETESERAAKLEEVRAAANRALDRAVALDPDNVETLLAQASDFVAEQEDVQFRTSRKQFIDRAIELDPDNAYAWYVLAWWYRIENDFDEATPLFRKALELDPLHARIVTGALFHFRNIGDEEMTAMLFERLTQIAPEKREDISLATIPVAVRLENILALFAETADPAVIESYAEEFREESESFRSETEKALYETILLQMQDDFEALVDYEIDGLPEEPVWPQLVTHIFAKNNILYAQQIAGRHDDAAATAGDIISTKEKWAANNKTADVQFLEVITVPAHLELDQIEETRELRDFLAASSDDLITQRGPWAVQVLSQFDLDRAVRLVLEQKTGQPSWPGTDRIALAHVATRHFLTHPDMQAFYVEEGKWMDYLAERVPEYAKYKQ